jgi:hypothetical protein
MGTLDLREKQKKKNGECASLFYHFLLFPHTHKTKKSPMSTNPLGWDPIHYEDRDPRRGKRTNRYHAMKLFPNYSQFASYGQGVNFSDVDGRQYRVADGIDRAEYVDRGLVAAGNPYGIEPVIYYDERAGKNKVAFTDLFRVSGTGDLGRIETTKSRTGVATQNDFSTVSRGAQLLYVRIPISTRKNNTMLTLPEVGDVLKMVHEPTDMLVKCTVKETDGFQFKNPATGSVFVDDLVFMTNTPE